MKVFIYDRTEIKQNLRNEHKRERKQFDPMKLKSSCIFLQGDRSIAVPIAEWKETWVCQRRAFLVKVFVILKKNLLCQVLK